MFPMQKYYQHPREGRGVLFSYRNTLHVYKGHPCTSVVWCSVCASSECWLKLYLLPNHPYLTPEQSRCPSHHPKPMGNSTLTHPRPPLRLDSYRVTSSGYRFTSSRAYPLASHVFYMLLTKALGGLSTSHQAPDFISFSETRPGSPGCP